MNRSLEHQTTPIETPPAFRSGYVAVIGKPNVGKSTLLNTYLGQKISIVSSKPQTTRDRIIGILTQPNAQVVFIDTPGIHQAKHALGQHMIDMAYSAIKEADAIVFMVDVTAPPDEDDQRIAQMLHGQPDVRSVILALNKMDHAPSPEKLKQNVEAFWALAKTPTGQQPPAPWDWIMLSASNNRNCTELLEKIIAALPEGPMFYPADQVTDRQERDIAAELIREQALLHLKQEVPHSVAVAIEQYEERPNGSVHITATIYVERDSQKGIMIGSGGQMLKQIGADARHEIQRLIDNKVFLELWVKVRKNWREDESELRKLGYTSNE